MKVAIVVIILAVAGLFATRVIQKQQAADEAAELARLEAERRVDLSALPEAASKPVEPERRKPAGSKPVMVELSFKSKKKIPLGAYKVINAAGETLQEDETPPTGESVVLILSPGEYRLEVPSRKFKHAFMVGAQEHGEKQAMTVTVR
jgi:hypothetical protein